MLGEDTNVSDTMGPWGVFQNAMLPGPADNHPFDLMTVARTRDLVTMKGGLRVQPQHSIMDAPQPDIVVVPAQVSHSEMLHWLKKVSEKADVVMAICAGTFQLARAGLLDGIRATVHHDYWDSFAHEFPNIELRRGPLFVDNGKIAMAGGLTSGIDVALHIVWRYFGDEVAQKTATYLEHEGKSWRDERRAYVVGATNRLRRLGAL